MERSKCKGKDWFDMKAPELTEERKNDLMIVKMRDALDPKRFYSAPDLKGLPKFFQVRHLGILFFPCLLYSIVFPLDGKSGFGAWRVLQPSAQEATEAVASG
jgi:hypothetical protein